MSSSPSALFPGGHLVSDQRWTWMAQPDQARDQMLSSRVCWHEEEKKSAVAESKVVCITIPQFPSTVGEENKTKKQKMHIRRSQKKKKINRHDLVHSRIALYLWREKKNYGAFPYLPRSCLYQSNAENFPPTISAILKELKLALPLSHGATKAHQDYYKPFRTT